MTNPGLVGRSLFRERTTGDEILSLARSHLRERYVLGTRVPMTSPDWTGPWDCAELASWCVYQASGILFGTDPQDDPVRAEAYSGYWANQARRDAATVSVEDAMRIKGAVFVREPKGPKGGHIAISDGSGGTVEAYSSLRGVIEYTADHRSWEFGVCVPGISYYMEEAAPTYTRPSVITVSKVLMRSDRIRAMQIVLAAEGFPVGAGSGIYDPQTAYAVQLFQARNGLVADGELGEVTEAELRKLVR